MVGNTVNLKMGVAFNHNEKLSWELQSRNY